MKVILEKIKLETLKKRREFLEIRRCGVFFKTSSVAVQAMKRNELKPKRTISCSDNKLNNALNNTLNNNIKVSKNGNTIDNTNSKNVNKTSNSLFFGFTVSKKVGKSHIRNKVKRRIRAIIRELLKEDLFLRNFNFCNDHPSNSLANSLTNSLVIKKNSAENGHIKSNLAFVIIARKVAPLIQFSNLRHDVKNSILKCIEYLKK